MLTKTLPSIINPSNKISTTPKTGKKKTPSKNSQEVDMIKSGWEQNFEMNTNTKKPTRKLEKKHKIRKKG